MSAVDATDARGESDFHRPWLSLHTRRLEGRVCVLRLLGVGPMPGVRTYER